MAANYHVTGLSVMLPHGWIYLADKSKFNLLDLDSNKFQLKPLIMGIRGLNRYNGNVPFDLKPYGYSVLEHLLNCESYAGALNYSEETALRAMVHDLGESISGDFTRPVKAILPCEAELEAWQVKCQDWVHRGLGITLSKIQQQSVKTIDDSVIGMELYHFYDKANINLNQSRLLGLQLLHFGQDPPAVLYETYLLRMQEYGYSHLL